MFICYYCSAQCNALSSIIEHCTEQHGNELLKYKEQILDTESGCFGFQTKIHENIVPCKLQQLGKTIQVDERCVYIRDQNSKKKRLSTPVKSVSSGNSARYYSCSYCETTISTLKGIVEHCADKHAHCILKYQAYVLDKETNKYGFQTKRYEGLIPLLVAKDNKKISVVNNKVVIEECYKNVISGSSKRQLSFTANGHKFTAEKVTEDFVSTEQILSTESDEVTPESADKTSTNETEHAPYEDSEHTSIETVTQEDALQEMVNLLPNVLASLHEHGLTESYLRFNRLLNEGKLPLDNICFLLFIDVVNWFYADSTTHMRYQQQTLQFWQIGYRLFHGKFLRFMSGLKNYGQLLEGVTDKGYFIPSDSRINFAVPARNNLFPTDNSTRGVFPGICFESLEFLADRFRSSPMKLCVDGKKICRGKGKIMGDIDCWGHESNPSLNEKKTLFKEEMQTIADMHTRLDTVLQKGITGTHNDIINEDLQNNVVCDCLAVIQRLAESNQQLREKVEVYQRLEEKFKKMGGKDWMKSRFYPVICSVRTNRSEVKHQIQEGLALADKFGYYVATLNGCQSTYREGDTLNLVEQGNYHSLNEKIDSHNSRLIKQRSEKWMDIRKTAIVTGSTCNNALGLGKLKDQQSHYDRVILKKETSEVIPDDVRERMDFGVKHEIDAISTLCGKILPVFNSELSYFEEGCVKLEHDENVSFMVVSPDGSLRTSENSAVQMAYETKCKAPSAYQSTAYYAIPRYYVTQLLCEMHALGCKELIFTCWSMQSTTVFHVQFDESLWEKCWMELTRVFDAETGARPKRFSEETKHLKTEVRRFCKTNVTLIAEFPSIRYTSILTEDAYSNDKIYSTPVIKADVTEDIQISDIQESLVMVRSWHENAYCQLRTVATEILMFMVTDLDRAYDMEQNNAHVVAYAMKGPSLRNDVLREMMRDVINSCEGAGLNIVVTSSDGQWHQYGIKDDKSEPLTILQLEKQLWSKVLSMEKKKLQTKVRNMNVVKELEDVRWEKKDGTVIIHGHIKDTFKRKMSAADISIDSEKHGPQKDEVEHDKDETQDHPEGMNQPMHQSMQSGLEVPESLQYFCLDNAEELDAIYTTCTQDMTEQDYERKGYETHEEGYNKEPIDQMSDLITDILQMHVYSDKVEEEIVDFENEFVTMETCDVSDTSTSAVISMAYETLYADSFGNYLDNTQISQEETNVLNDGPVCVAETHTGDINVSETENYCTAESDQCSKDNTPDIYHDAQCTSTEKKIIVIESLNTDDYISIWTEFQSSAEENDKRNWNSVSLNEFVQMSENKKSMDRCFQKKEVQLFAKLIEKLQKFEGFTIKSNFPKYKVLSMLYDEPVSLRKEDIFVTGYKSKKSKPKTVESLKTIAWSAIKNRKKEELAVAVANTEWNSVYNEWIAKGPIPTKTEIESLSCVSLEWFSQPRVDADGNVRFHFTDACHLLTCLRTKLCTTGIKGLSKKAWEVAALSKETKLNISVVVDCVDKQDVALARRVFDEDVESVMVKNDYISEAKFCSLIRRWFDAEDEPSIPAIERCQRRLELRNWLLEDFVVGQFPPPTQYIHGIPIVTYEALLSHLERKIQLFAFVPKSNYNVRATGTQEVEQLFSTFRDLDPAGIGTPKPDVIPEMLATAIEIDNFKMDPEKPFYMKTSKAEVYPADISLSKSPNVTDLNYIRDSETAKTITSITVRDHFFDSEARSLRKHKRRSGTVSKPNHPAHGERGVRQYHARDDSKIPAHRRLGLLELPDC